MSAPTHENGASAVLQGHLPPSETSPLLDNDGIINSNEDNKDGPSWRQDAWLMTRNSVPVIFAGLLQHSLSITTIFSVGHIGKIELGAVSLAVMSANITGYAIYQGMATALDTLCAQAYGSGKKHLVGLYFQQMILLLWLLTIPIGVVWVNADTILGIIVPNRTIAELSGAYLRILLFGAPGYAAFESGKRFLQAQGIFDATTYILLVAAPLNAFGNWLLVWKLQLGFIGAPISVAITNNLLPFALFLYVVFIDGSKCWNGFTTQAFRNWDVMIKLAFPGFLMIEAEYLAFEVLTLAASYLSTTQLAAGSIISPLIALTFQVPLALAIASSTQIANLIGAGLPQRAKQCATIAMTGALIIGVANFILMLQCGGSAARWLTNDESVIKQVIIVMPVIATFQLFDSLMTTLNGLLRGIGKQVIGSVINLFCYYAIGLPISFAAAFYLRWELIGLWAGIAVALCLNSLLMMVYLGYHVSWDAVVEASRQRNAKAAEEP